MPKFSLTRRQLLASAAPIVASVPLVKLGLDRASAQELPPPDDDFDPHDHTHAAHIGAEVPAPGEPNDTNALLYPPPATPYQPGRLKEYDLTAIDVELEVAPGVFYPAWTYNSTAPGPVIRATEDDLLRVNFVNAGTHPHTIHFHGIHPANMDGVFEVVDPGGSFVYEFPARPWGLHLYHCHSTPLKKHVAKGLYGAFIVDPPEPRPPAQELVMVMNGFDTDFDGRTTSTPSTASRSSTPSTRSSSAGRRPSASTSSTSPSSTSSTPSTSTATCSGCTGPERLSTTSSPTR